MHSLVKVVAIAGLSVFAGGIVWVATSRLNPRYRKHLDIVMAIIGVVALAYIFLS